MSDASIQGATGLSVTCTADCDACRDYAHEKGWEYHSALASPDPVSVDQRSYDEGWYAGLQHAEQMAKKAGPMTTPQDATEAMRDALHVLEPLRSVSATSLVDNAYRAEAVITKLHDLGYTVTETAELERLRRVEAAAGDIAELVPMYSETFDTGPDMAALRAALGDPS